MIQCLFYSEILPAIRATADNADRRFKCNGKDKFLHECDTYKWDRLALKLWKFRIFELFNRIYRIELCENVWRYEEFCSILEENLNKNKQK